MMELASLVVVHIYVSQKLQLSPFRLLGFVLEKQWRLVQLKLSTWLLFMLQISLVQFGTSFMMSYSREGYLLRLLTCLVPGMDFSFKFQYDT